MFLAGSFGIMIGFRNRAVVLRWELFLSGLFGEGMDLMKGSGEDYFHKLLAPMDWVGLIQTCNAKSILEQSS